jgi:hypothetical protein
MDAYTRDQIIGAFRGATRSEVKKVTFAANFDAIDFGKLDYYGWTDPKIPRRAYVLVDRPDGPVALLLSRAAVKPRARAMCTWCNDVNLSDEAVLYTVRRCANFGCSRNVRQLPPAYHKGTDLDGIREQQVGKLRRKVHGFVNEVLSTED